MRADENSLNTQDIPAAGFLDRMQFFYELFPYPNRPLLMRPNPEGSLEAHAGFSKIIAEKGSSLTHEHIADLKLRDLRFAFPAQQKIALVGCGTDEPLLFRILHPHNPIIAIDLSLKSLQRAQRKINWNRLRPVTLVQGDASHALGEYGPFAHIQCFGVLHHQPEPKMMISSMADALERNGTLRLMIYSRTGRRLERGIQRKFLDLWKPASSNTSARASATEPPSRSHSAWKLSLTSLKLLWWRLALPLIAPKTLALRFRYVGLSRARVADAFLHPSDHPLDLRDVLLWSRQAGLELVSHEAQSYDLGRLASHSDSPQSLDTLVSEEDRGNISSNIVLVFKKVGAGTWTTK
jgi:SAM-dependent methyltransferase